jgi:predicted dienelactone hydrolase
MVYGALLAGVTLLGLLAWSAAFASVMVPGDKLTRPTSLDHDEAPYAGPGPHRVGIRNLVIDDGMPLEMTVWYPASKLGARQSAITYPYQVKMFTSRRAIALATFQGQAIRSAAFDLSAAPYPLVILSPGFAIGVTTYAWLAEHLASRGFVVIAPEHHEQLDPSTLWRSTIDRPRAIAAVLSYVDEQAGSGGKLQGLTNTDHAGVIGHSYGGYTALAAAGARLDTAGLERTCETARRSDDPVVFLCDALEPHLRDMAALAGLDTTPEGLWPDWSDSRVEAAVSMAGDAVVFGPAGLAEVTVPVMAMGGTADRDSPFRWATQLTYEHVSSPRRVEVALDDGDHFVFTGPCEAVRRIMTVMPNGFCSLSGWERSHAHELISHFTTAFLLAELKRDPVAAAALTPTTERFSGVTYSAIGY